MNDITNGKISSSQTSSSQATSSQPLNDEANKEQREHHRIKFNKWLADDYPKVLEEIRIKKNTKKGVKVSEDQENEHHSTSSIISWEKAQLIKDCLLSKHNEKIDPQFKNWVATRRFNLIEENDEMKLYRNIVVKTSKNKQVVFSKEENLPVAIKEDFFSILYALHCVQKGHVGMNKTHKHVKERYHHLPRIISDHFIRLCGICGLNLIQHSQPRIQPIRSDSFRERFQLDLVDMRHNPSSFSSMQYLMKKKQNLNKTIIMDRKYVWIAHVQDTFLLTLVYLIYYILTMVKNLKIK
jgi:hypothetical protein